MEFTLSQLDRSEIDALIAGADWRQRWEILPGIFTSGVSDIDPKYILDEFGVPEDLTGKRCIDIGAWDGALTFELERRGGTVLAADIQHPDATAFNTARTILGSKVDYLQASVYDLPDLLAGQEFDVVIFRAVWYHLKNPIGAFEAISRISAAGAILCSEGEILRYYAEDMSGHPIDSSLIGQLADLDVPITLCYPGTYKGGENWFVPNVACFRGWMTACGFEIVQDRIWEDHSLNGQRLIVTCVRTTNNIAVEHTVLDKGWRKQTDSTSKVVKGQLIRNSRLSTVAAATEAVGKTPEASTPSNTGISKAKSASQAGSKAGSGSSKPAAPKAGASKAKKPKA